MPRSTTDILASNYTARPRTAGRRFRRPHIRPSPRAMRRTTCGAVPSTGVRRASGRLRRAAPTSPGDPVRDTTGRPVPLDRPRPELADSASAVGRSQAQAMDGRWRRSARDPFDLRRSARFQASVDCVSTGGIWFTENTGESWTLRGERNARRICAARADARPHRSGRALPGAAPCGAGAHVGAAPQRHLRLLR